MATLVSLTDVKEAVFFDADISPRHWQEISVAEDALEVTTGSAMQRWDDAVVARSRTDGLCPRGC
jgi:hypothetical protein